MNTAALYIFFFSGSGIGPVPPDTHDGGHYLHKHSAKKRHLALLKREYEKLAEREKLRRLIELSAYGEAASISEQYVPRPKAAKSHQLPEKSHDYSLQLMGLEIELALLAQQILEAKRRREEDDIHAILLTIL